MVFWTSNKESHSLTDVARELCSLSMLLLHSFLENWWRWNIRSNLIWEFLIWLFGGAEIRHWSFGFSSQLQLRGILSTFGSEGREDRGVGWTYVMRRDVEEDCWYVQPRDELRPAASLTVVGHIIVLFRRPFLSRTPFPDSPVCHDTLAWVLGTGGPSCR